MQWISLSNNFGNEARFYLTCGRPTYTLPRKWLKPQYPDLSLGTVYRNLAMFKEQGQIMSVGTVNGAERFDGNTKPHVHFICTGCNAVSDLPQIEVPEELNRKVVSQTGGQVSMCQLTFVGLCNQCSEKQKEKGESA